MTLSVVMNGSFSQKSQKRSAFLCALTMHATNIDSLHEVDSGMFGTHGKTGYSEVP